MIVLAIWAAILGYALTYAGLVNWSGGSLSVADALTGRRPAGTSGTPAPSPSPSPGPAETIVTPQPVPGQPATVPTLPGWTT